ncbi:restriction endonuclease subunit S [Acetobacter fabarum]|uniref:restriction endonuclease subunit S n=1 Tax=Acetobacter fabarum TaxID=483199 RepID=UPI0039E984B0
MSERPENIQEEHWKPLGKISDIEMGQSPPSNYISEGLDEGLPFLQGNAEFGVMSPHPKYSCALPAKIGKAGSLLISVRAPVGAVNIADQNYCIGRGLAAIFPKRYPASFVAAAVSRRSSELARVSQGTTFEAIGKRELNNLCVYAPDQSTASKIAEILDTLDAAIRGTEAVVAKLKAMKQGLLHDLLTRGIDANGDLRPPQPEAPHLYKHTLLGWLPKEWEEPSLEEITASPICYGIVQVFGYVDTGVPVLAIRDLLGDYQTGIHRTAKHIDAQYPRSRVKSGDVLLSIKGTIGRVGLVPDHFKGNISRDIGLLRPNQRVISSYLTLLLRSALGQAMLSDAQVGTTRAELSIGPLKKLRIPLPPLPEQSVIAKKVDSIDHRIQEEESILSKRYLLQSGLMDDLLTGRTSVTPLL